MSLQYPEDQSFMVVFIPLNLTQETVFCTKRFKWMSPTLHNGIPGFLKKEWNSTLKLLYSHLSGPCIDLVMKNYPAACSLSERYMLK